MKIKDLETTYWLNGLTPPGVWRTVEDTEDALATDTLWTSKCNHTACYATITCTSTMDIAQRLFQMDKFPESAWIIAQSQMHGRGQLGRNWLSPKGNLYSTIRLPDQCKGLKNMLPLGIAVVITRILEHFQIHAKIKWPNDILLNKRKIGGILIEERGEAVFAGIGLNVATSPSVYLPQKNFRIPAGCLADFGCRAGVHQIWRLITPELRKRLLGWLDDPRDLRNEMKSRLAYKNKNVFIHESGVQSYSATILDIAPCGGLEIATKKGRKTLTSGQIYPVNSFSIERDVSSRQSPLPLRDTTFSTAKQQGHADPAESLLQTIG